MDAKMRANFINSVAGGQKIPCPSCNTLNNADASFCITCGRPLKETVPNTATSKKICPACNTENDADSLFCVSCGTKLGENQPIEANNVVPVVTPVQQEPTPVIQQNNTAAAPAFNPVKRPAAAPTANAAQQNNSAEKNQAFKFVEPKVVKEEEEVSVFAQGLPAWDIVPPQIMVRRKAKR